MANETQPKQQKPTATERLNNLEQVVTSMFQSSNMMARDLNILKDAVKLLGNKLQSVVQALAEGTTKITDELISEYMVKNNVVELTQKVANLVAAGMLLPTDLPTDLNSFAVFEELDAKEDIVRVPRTQFVIGQLADENARTKLTGVKIGDTVTVEEGKMRLRLLENYQIVQVEQNPDELSEDVPSDDTQPADSADAADAKAATTDATPAASTPAQA